MFFSCTTKYLSENQYLFDGNKLKVINKEIEQLLADEREAYNKTFKGKHDILNAQLLKKLQNKSDEVENKINNAQEEEIAENYQHLLTWKKFKTN
jgi:hypothetical protein